MSEVQQSPTLEGKIAVLSGFAFSSSDFNQIEGLPLIRIRDLGGSTTEVRFRGRHDQTYRVIRGDLLIGMDGDFEVHRWGGDDALLNQRVCKISTASRSIDQNFLYWYLKPEIAEIHRKTPQTTVRHLSTKDVYSINEPSIGVNEQIIVAKILDTLDTAIRETEAIIAKLKAVKQGLLHDLLTRGIGANGELRPPLAEAPQLYKQSPLGWVPKGWGIEELGQVLAEPTRNGLYKQSQFHGRGPLMVQMGGLFAGEAAGFQTAIRIQVSPSELNIFGLAVGDLLFARRSLVFEGAGLCVIVRHLPEPATFESSIVRVRVCEDVALPEFVCQFLRGEASSAQRRTLIRQVAVSGVSSSDIRQLFIAIPPLPEQKLIVDRQFSSQLQIESETKVVEKLRNHKSGLMNDLLTGHVRVTPC